MELWPAIDVRDGRCVRLVQGDFGAETVYGDPLEVARNYVAAGARRLHVVDLDAARLGVPAHADVVVAIARTTGATVQAGGGIRDERSAAALLDGGVSRVVVGTAAIEDPSLLSRLSERWPGRVAVGLDYERSGGAGTMTVAVRGWTHKTGALLLEVAGALADLELAAVVATDISRDGTARGPDLDGLAALLEATGHDVIASGGVGTGDDLRRLRRLTAGGSSRAGGGSGAGGSSAGAANRDGAGKDRRGNRLAGVIVGRALLSGALSLEEALGICERVAP